MRAGALLGVVACVVVVLPLAASARPASTPGSVSAAFIVGIDDDHAKWLTRPDGLLAKYRDLGLGAVRVTIPWRRGQTRPTTLVGVYLHRAAAMLARGQRVVISVFGKPSEAPVDAKSRKQYCDFLHHVLVRVPFRARAASLRSARSSNFELLDEDRLAGWQSGVLWRDGTHKPSYEAFKAAVRVVASGAVDCSTVAGGTLPPWPP